MHKGRSHGKGKYKFADGDVYDVQWLDGLRHGIGTQQYKNGETLKGNGFQTNRTLVSDGDNHAFQISKCVSNKIKLNTAYRFLPIIL